MSAGQEQSHSSDANDLVVVIWPLGRGVSVCVDSRYCTAGIVVSPEE